MKEPGIIGLASDLVRSDETYRGIVAYLLGRVLVAEDIDAAIAVAKKNHYSLHIVTLEGEYLSPGGSMTGGSFRNNSNLLGRNREIEDLQKQLDQLRSPSKRERNGYLRLRPPRRFWSRIAVKTGRRYSRRRCGATRPRSACSRQRSRKRRARMPSAAYPRRARSWIVSLPRLRRAERKMPVCWESWRRRRKT